MSDRYSSGGCSLYSVASVMAGGGVGKSRLDILFSVCTALVLFLLGTRQKILLLLLSILHLFLTILTLISIKCQQAEKLNDNSWENYDETNKQLGLTFPLYAAVSIFSL